MAQIIMDHVASGCFGTSLAPSKGFSFAFNGGSETGQPASQFVLPSRRCSIMLSSRSRISQRRPSSSVLRRKWLTGSTAFHHRSAVAKGRWRMWRYKNVESGRFHSNLPRICGESIGKPTIHFLHGFGFFVTKFDFQQSFARTDVFLNGLAVVRHSTPFRGGLGKFRKRNGAYFSEEPLWIFWTSAT